MDGLKMYFRDVQGAQKEILLNRPQYIFLEPKERLVVRYRIIRHGLEGEATKISRQTKTPELLICKVLVTESKLLSKIKDFEDIESDPIYTFPIDFTNKSEIIVDVLYESLSEDRLKLKVGVFSERDEAFENENTITDGPDEFVRTVNVTIDFDAVYYTYLFRRKGRLRKHVGRATWIQLSEIWKERELSIVNHVDKDIPREGINKAVRDQGWKLDYLHGRVTKTVDKREIEVTEEELASVLRTSARPSEVLGLLRSNNIRESKHPLLKAGESLLQDCDNVCSLQEATPKTLIDKRDND